jgi:tetratricopeptide (TPR) repeat protein
MSFPTEIDLQAQARLLSQEGADLIAQGRPGDARLALREALALQSNLADAHHHLGHALRLLGQPQQALQAYQQALSCNAEHLPSHLHLALLFEELDRRDEAIGVYRHVLDRHPDVPEVRHSLGTLLEDMGRHAEAEAVYREAIRLRPDYFEAHLCLAEILLQRGQLPQAEAHYRQAVALDAGNPRTLERLAAVLHRQDQYEEAVALYRQVLARDPADADTWSNMATALDLLNRLEDAEAAFRQALALHAEFADAAFGLALVLLRQGRLAEAWPLYEFRYHPQRQSHLSYWAEPQLDCPSWRGESLQGKSLVVWQEQGHGDMIQFVRYLPLLKAQGARRITLVCMEPLGPLFEAQPGIDAVVTIRKSATLDDVQKLLGHDYWTFIMSLPHALGTTADTIPSATAYLQPDPARLGHWGARLNALPGPKIGLCWKGNAKHSNDRNRSLPGLHTLAPLWQVLGLSFVSVQKGQGEEQAFAPPAGQPLLHLGSDIQDFGDSAALIAQLDLLICVDTAVAHLAGALGVPCWVLLPAEGTDWRWTLEGDTSPWYPGAMRLFRQTASGDWSGPVAQVRQALATCFPGSSAALSE